MATPSAPPRFTGDPIADSQSIINWLWSFYQSVVLEQAYATQADVNATVDPTSATAATAQTTANEALALAQTLDDTLGNLAAGGAATIADVATTVVVTIPTQDDTSYFVVAAAEAFTGAPATNSLIVKSITKTTSSFTITVVTAPGAGTSVSFAWILFR